MDGSETESCPLAGSGVSGDGLLGSAAMELFVSDQKFSNVTLYTKCNLRPLITDAGNIKPLP
jgi:hypothetical protein